MPTQKLLERKALIVGIVINVLQVLAGMAVFFMTGLKAMFLDFSSTAISVLSGMVAVKLSQFDEKPYICGERCWQLRCEYLHQNKGFLNDENNIRFHLGLNCGMSVCQLDSMNIQENGNDIRIDIEQFCLRMCKAAKSYYDKVHLEKDFSLYNTPVLDFIQVTQKKESCFYYCAGLWQ